MTFRLKAAAAVLTVSVLALIAFAVTRPPSAEAHPLGNFTDRIGWKEIVVQPAHGVALLNSTASTEDVSHELTAYPADLLSSPLDVREANLSFDARGGAPAPAITAAISAPQKAPGRAGA